MIETLDTVATVHFSGTGEPALVDRFVSALRDLPHNRLSGPHVTGTPGAGARFSCEISVERRYLAQLRAVVDVSCALGGYGFLIDTARDLAGGDIRFTPVEDLSRVQRTERELRSAESGELNFRVNT